MTPYMLACALRKAGPRVTRKIFIQFTPSKIFRLMSWRLLFVRRRSDGNEILIPLGDIERPRKLFNRMTIYRFIGHQNFAPANLDA